MQLVLKDKWQLASQVVSYTYMHYKQYSTVQYDHFILLFSVTFFVYLFLDDQFKVCCKNIVRYVSLG